MSVPTALPTESTPEVSTESSPEGPPRRVDRWAWLWFLPVAALLVVLTALQVNQYSSISIFDEPAHWGYVDEVGDGRLPYYGTIADQDARAEYTCRLWEARIGFDQFPCARGEGGPDVYPSESYPGQAAIYTADHPPTYYVVAAATVAALTDLPSVASGLTAARLSNVVWVLVALLGLWDAMRRLGVRPWARVVGAGILLATPQALYFAGIVNPDIAVMAASALALDALVRHDVTRQWSWLVGLGALSGVLVKTTGVVLPVIVAVFLVVRAWQEAVSGVPEGRSWWSWSGWPRLKALLWCLAFSLPAFVAWRTFQAGRSTVPDGFSFTIDRNVDEFPAAGLITLQNVFLLDSGGAETVDDPWVVFANRAMALLLPVLAVAAIAVIGWASRESATAITGLLGPFVAGALLVTFLYVTSESFVTVIPRYLNAGLPFQVAAAAAFLSRAGRPALIPVSAVVLATTAAYVLSLVRFE